jgi:hypothetical protein
MPVACKHIQTLESGHGCVWRLGNRSAGNSDCHDSKADVLHRHIFSVAVKV